MNESLVIVSPKESDQGIINALIRMYEIPDIASVKAYLGADASLVKAVIDAKSYLSRLIGDRDVKVTIFTDPEYMTKSLYFIVKGENLSVDEAIEIEDKFRLEWLFSQDMSIVEALNISVEF